MAYIHARICTHDHILTLLSLCGPAAVNSAILQHLTSAQLTPPPAAAPCPPDTHPLHLLALLLGPCWLLAAPLAQLLRGSGPARLLQSALRWPRLQRAMRRVCDRYLVTVLLLACVLRARFGPAFRAAPKGALLGRPCGQL